jgi:hypothetical protein
MVDYKRIKLKISDLPLESSFKIFNFLKELLEIHQLKKSVLEEQLPNFTAGEKYFIVHLAKQYYDRFNPKSYLIKWIKNNERTRSDITQFTLEKIKLEIHSEELVRFCNSIEETLKRRFRYQLIHYPNTEEFPSTEQIYEVADVASQIKSFKLSNKDNKQMSKLDEFVRIPIFHNDIKFLRFVQETLSSLFTKQQIKKFINNMFYVTANNTFAPLQYLYLEIDNSGVFYERIFKIYKRYNGDIKKDIQDRTKTKDKKTQLKIGKRLDAYEKKLRAFSVIELTEKEIQRALKQRTEKEKQMYVLRKSYSVKPNKATKFDFMSVLYFSFPQIRDSYQKAKSKDSELQLSDYLLTKSRNIKNA